MKRHLFNLHNNFHYDPELVEMATPGEGFPANEKEIVEELEDIDFGYIQISAKGLAGYPTWPSKLGPKPKTDYMAVWRKACDKLGVGLAAYYCACISKVEGLRHPEWVQRRVDGSLFNCPNGRFSICFNSPYAEEIVIPELIDLIKRYRVEGIWVDGDGFSHPLCHCETCKRVFAAKYPDHEFPASEDSLSYIKAVQLYREAAFEYMRKVKAAVKKEKPSCWITFIWAYSISWPKDPEHVDFISFDTEQDFCEPVTDYQSRYLGAREDGPHEIMPFHISKSSRSRVDGMATSRQIRPIRTLLMEEASILANGCTWNLITWPSASGHLLPQATAQIKTAAEFFAQRQKYFVDTKSFPMIAVLVSEYAAEKYIPSITGNVIGSSRQFELYIEGAASILNCNNMHFDIINEKTLIKRIHQYQFVIIPDMEFSSDLDSKLKEFVSNGGTLLASHKALARYNSEGKLKTGLKDLFGVELIEEEKDKIDRSIPFDFRCLNHHGEPVPVQYQPFIRTQAIEADITDYMYADWRMCHKVTPYVFTNSFGKGKAVYICGSFFKWAVEYHPLKRSWFKELVSKNVANLSLKVKTSPRVMVSFRHKGNDGLLHLVNRERLGPPGGILSDDIMPQQNIGISLRSDVKPEDITLQPGNERLVWDWDGRQIELTVPRLDIHSVIVIKNIFRKNQVRRGTESVCFA